MSIKNKIEKIINQNKGVIFSINDFYILETKDTVKSVLYRLNEKKKITRIIDGLYSKLIYSRVLKEYIYIQM